MPGMIYNQTVGSDQLGGVGVRLMGRLIATKRVHFIISQGKHVTGIVPVATRFNPWSLSNIHSR